MEVINTETGLLGSRESHEVCSKFSRQEKANTPFDLQSFEHDIFKSLSILLFLKYTKNIYYYWALKKNTCHIFSIRKWSMHIKGMSNNVKLQFINISHTAISKLMFGNKTMKWECSVQYLILSGKRY